MANTHSVNGALAAARFAGTGRQKEAPWLAPVDRPIDGIDTAKLTERVPFKEHISYRVGSGGLGTLQPPHSVRGRSPSQIAATLAVSRSFSNDRQSQSAPGARRVSPLRKIHDNVQSKAPRLDLTPNPGTNTLVELFESKNASKSLGSGKDLLYVPGGPGNIVSPTPTRPSFATRSSTNSAATLSGPTDPYSNQDHMQSPLLQSPAKLDAMNKNAAVTAARLGSPLKAHRTQVVVQSAAGDPKPEPPPLRRWPHQQARVAPQDQAWSRDPSSTKYLSRLDSTLGTLLLEGDTSRDEPSRGVSIKDTSPLQGASVSQGSASRTASFSTQARQVSTSNAQVRETWPAHRRAESQMTVNSLANAIVASSLASSRAPSPSKPIPPLPRRHTKPYSLFRQHHNHDESASRTPSPSKGMRQTMRGPPKSDDDDEYKRGSSNIIKKHPNKHHEGDRKRWRDQITERERKRYEGVWAANRGMHLPESSQPAVCNLIVRDIWSRSRLSNHVLEEIWDLVDNEGVGRLNKEEFVVGMWLIDQSLKGRKLPVKVSDSVWSSVRRLTGIKIPKNRR